MLFFFDSRTKQCIVTILFKNPEENNHKLQTMLFTWLTTTNFPRHNGHTCVSVTHLIVRVICMKLYTFDHQHQKHNY